MLARTSWYYLVAKRNQSLSSSELSSFTDERVRKAIRYAYENVPYYHDLMEMKGLIPAEFKQVNDLGRIPSLSRNDIESNYPDRITSNSSAVGVLRHTSGTTTGRPLEVRWSLKYADLVMGLRMRRTNAQGVSLLARGTSVNFAGPEADPSSVHSISSPLKKYATVLFGSFHTEYPVLRLTILGLGPDTLELIAERIVDSRPQVLRSRPSYLRRLGKIIKERHPSFSVSKIISGGESTSRAARKEISDLYSGEVLATYGCHEIGSLGFECTAHNGIHLNSDFIAFEFIAKDGQTASEGEEAEILLTTLDNEAMPLIRYRLGDRVVLEKEEKCECGSSLIRLREIEGRISDGLCASDLDQVPPGVIVEYVETTLGMRDFQIIQTGPDRLKIRYRPNDERLARGELPEYLNRILRRSVKLEYSPWDGKELPVKFRPVFSDNRTQWLTKA